ncbi:hypothetical protein [Halorussus halophilus]|uniref:hypothetical protein n=1 Tax=Halorussus halophilus TaxID=2650975 RepID=UPI001301539A|nr:hypothetical protein [Halorussus halophilus]
MTLSFRSTAEPTGIEIRDHVEQRVYELSTASDVSPSSVSTERFLFPVDDAVSIRTDAISLPQIVATYLRDSDGTMRAEILDGTQEVFPNGKYYVELCAPMKLYLAVEGPISVSATAERFRFEFDSEAEVLIGARSHHERPAATVTTTRDPTDVMTAISAFSSALKTTSPERSFPTLRGHPPQIELGEELHVPDELEIPETDVRIEVPPTLSALYVVAPLAFYLGAELAPGQRPRIVTDSGFTYDLEGPLGYEQTVERVLKQTFFFDCLVRTEGLYEVDLHERRAVEPLVDLDFEALYDSTIGEQLEGYLSVEFETIEEYLPKWKLTTHVEPTSDNVESLPFVVNDLAVVRTPKAHEQSPQVQAQPATTGEFVRDGDFTRSAAESSGEMPLVHPERTDSVEQAWLGDHAPKDASKVTAKAFRNRISRDVSEGTTEITVVCNDTEMGEESDLATEVYGSRAELPFEVTVHRNLSTDELREVLQSETAFLHYIGHIGEDGFECADGTLDATTVESVGVEAFLLNACSSYEQGLALVDAGSVGGVVTLSDVINSGAVRVGKTMIRLLNRGFPLRAALTIARGRSIVGDQYIVVGDGNVDVVQTESGLAALYEIERDGEEFLVTHRSYTPSTAGLGGFFSPEFVENRTCYLNSGVHGPFSLTRDELSMMLLLENLPLVIDGQFTWSESLDLGSL